MNTATRTAPSNTRRPASAQQEAPSIGLRKFTIAERWVEVAAPILARHAEIVTHQPRFRPDWLHYIFNDYANRLAVAATNGTQHAGARPFLVASMAWSAPRGRQLETVTFHIKEARWLAFLRNCEALEVSPVAMIRAAYAERIQYWNDNAAELRQAEANHAATLAR
jgi:hypothetical protein